MARPLGNSPVVDRAVAFALGRRARVAPFHLDELVEVLTAGRSVAITTRHARRAARHAAVKAMAKARARLGRQFPGEPRWFHYDKPARAWFVRKP